jgi:hypothetical protein
VFLLYIPNVLLGRLTLLIKHLYDLSKKKKLGLVINNHQLIGFSYNYSFLEILLADNLFFFFFFFSLFCNDHCHFLDSTFYISQFVLLDAVDVTVVQWAAKISPRISL